MVPPLFNSWEKRLMRRLIRLSKKLLGQTYPNPVTAAAIVKDHVILSEGVHLRPGHPHAEVCAINSAGYQCKDATLYITLEPCTHFGKQPPCVQAIINANIKRVVYAMDDPNPLVRQNPARRVLEAAGIQVDSGLCKQDALWCNEVFFKNQCQNRPFVRLKAGLSLDGKLALANGKSKYITGTKSLKLVHRLRQQASAVLIGSGTLLLDNPQLTIRHDISHNTQETTLIILDPQAKCPEHAAVFNSGYPILLVTSNHNYAFTLPSQVSVLELPLVNHTFDWDTLLKELYKRNIYDLLIEGGHSIFSTLIEQGCADKGHFFFAPKLIGGQSSLSLFSTPDISTLSDAIPLYHLKSTSLSPGILVEGYLNPLFKSL